METTYNCYKVHQCSKCPGDTENICVSCSCHLCSQCTEIHVSDLKTTNHNVIFYRENCNFILKQKLCIEHSDKVYKKYCEVCECPVCYRCREHSKHTQQNIRKAYLTKRQQQRETIHTIRSETLFYRHILLTEVKADFKTCHTKFSLYQQGMLTKAHRLKNRIDRVLCHFDFKHRCIKQRNTLNRHLASIKRYEQEYEQSAALPVQFLKRKSCLTEKEYNPTLTFHTSQLSMTEAFNNEDVIEHLSKVQIREIGRRHENDKRLRMIDPELLHSFSVKGVSECYHMSCVTSEKVWVSDRLNNLILANTSGDALLQRKDLCKDGVNCGSHTLNCEGELIYIQKNFNINKLSNDMKQTTTFIKTFKCRWKPRCLYWSLLTKDLLVGIYRLDLMEGRVDRYNQKGQLTQTIQCDEKGQVLFRSVAFITENNNGDLVVSDLMAVVVTDRRGIHRFTYTGHPPGSTLVPRGVCTDALSHILVCDFMTSTVQMINRDGEFLSHLLVRPLGIFSPQSLSYDVNTHCLWVGSECNNNMCVYSYITRQDSFFGK